MLLPKKDPHLASKIRVVQYADKFNLEIDGQEFPWHLSDDGVNVGAISHYGMPTVQITLLAESIEIVQSLDKAPVDLAKR